MKLALTISLCSLQAVIAAGCATSPAAKPKLSDNIKDTGLSAVAPRLTARDLKRGDCGLFVWSADEDRRFILFSQSQKTTAIWAGPNGEMPLVINETLGQVFQQQYTQQIFTEAAQKNNVLNISKLKLSLRNIEELLGSTRFKAGTLSQTTQDGTQRVIPIVGLSTCR